MIIPVEPTLYLTFLTNILLSKACLQTLFNTREALPHKDPSNKDRSPLQQQPFLTKIELQSLVRTS